MEIVQSDRYCFDAQHNSFLQRIATDDEEWVTYNNIKRKRLWWNRGKPAQAMVKPRLAENHLQ